MSDEFTKTAPQILAALAKDIYQDAAHPSLKTLGETLDGIFKAISHYPRYWGMMSEISLEQKQERFKERLAAKAALIPVENRILPKPNILGPSVQALEYGIFENHLSEMFADLIARSMDNRFILESHPSFVEIIKQLTSDEAKLIKYIGLQHSEIPVIQLYRKIHDDPVKGDDFAIDVRRWNLLAEEAGCEYAELIEQMIDNLERLRIIEVDISITGNSTSQESTYDRLEMELESRRNITIKNSLDNLLLGEYTTRNGYMVMTAFGRSFFHACLSSSR